MSDRTKEKISEVVSIEVLKRLTNDGICIILQTGPHQFSFVEKTVATLDLVKLATILIQNGCSEEQIEVIMSKIEG